MRFFDKKTTFFISLFSLFLIFIPKINLISLGESETAGLRIDDFIILFFSAFFFWAHISLRKKISDLELWMGGILGFSLLSFVLNKVLVAAGMLHVDAKIFYAVRIFEYFIFFYMGLVASQQFKLSSVFLAFVFWNMGIMLLQKAGILGKFGSSGYGIDMDRVFGIASFPSEMGLLLNMAFCYLIFTDDWRFPFKRWLPKQMQAYFRTTYVYWLFFLFTYFVVLTGARIAILAQLVCFLIRLKDEFSLRSVKKLILASFFGLLIASFLVLKGGAIFRRTEALLSWKNVELITMVWDSVDVDYVPMGNEAVDYDSAQDKSWWLRIHKWCYALKIYVQHPECYFQGVGPGFAMAALDGGFLRILVEYGIGGLLIFGGFFWTIANSSRVLFWVIFTMGLNMLFFDVYMAYKAMSLLFLMTGYRYGEMYQREEKVLVSRVYGM